MAAYIRALVRLFGFILVTFFIYLIYLSGLLVLTVLDRNYMNWRNRSVRTWTNWAVKILGMNIEIKGTPPEPPFLLVSNHLSYLDIIPFFAATHCIFVAKNEIRSWPLIGKMAQSIGIIFVDRSKKRDVKRVNNLIEANISGHTGIVVFPEGTTSKGNYVKTFKSPLLQYAVDEKIPVSYASITYRTFSPDHPVSEQICWWGEMTFVDHFFNLLKIRSFDAIIRFGEQPVLEDDRKKLADKLHQLVQHQFIPVDKYEQYV